jgi:uncharacterized caspase-like protein
MKKYGLFIGIDQYDDPEISPLTCAARDAQDLAGVFQYKFGFETAVLTHLDLKQGQRVMQKLRSFEAKLVPGDVFVLYFAGHGKTAGEADQLLLLPEVSASALAAGHAAGADVLSCLALRAHTDGWAGVSRVFIFDACRLPLAAAVASRGDGVEWDQALHFAGEAVYRALAFGREPQGALAALAAPHSPLAILNSCVDQERAEELPKLGHGLFTASLLEQLQAYDESAPLVVSQTLADALGVRMQALARQYTRRSTGQRPLLHGAEVALFAPDPLREQVRAAAVAQAQAAAQAKAREQEAARLQAGLRGDFARQLAGGQLDKPVGDNCVATLQQLQDMGQRDPSLNQALQAALDAREQAAWRESDQKQFEAASAVDTPEAYADYLKHCRLCAHKEQVQAAIRAVRGRELAGRTTPDIGSAESAWWVFHGGVAAVVLLGAVLVFVLWLGRDKKTTEASAPVASVAVAQDSSAAVPMASASQTPVAITSAASAQRLSASPPASSPKAASNFVIRFKRFGDKDELSKCLIIRDFPADEANFPADEANRFLYDVGLLKLVQATKSTLIQSVKYGVVITPLDRKEDVELRSIGLRGRGVEGFYPVEESAKPNRWSIILGIFNTQEAAQVHLQQLRQKGVLDAKIVQRYEEVTRITLMLRDATKETIDQIRHILPRYRLTEIVSCS